MLDHFINAVMSGIFVAVNKAQNSANSGERIEKKVIKNSGLRPPILYSNTDIPLLVAEVRSHIDNFAGILGKCLHAMRIIPDDPVGIKATVDRPNPTNYKYIQSYGDLKWPYIGLTYIRKTYERPYEQSWSLNLGMIEFTATYMNCMSPGTQTRAENAISEANKWWRTCYRIPPKGFGKNEYYVMTEYYSNPNGDPDMKISFMTDKSCDVERLPAIERDSNGQEWYDAMFYRVEQIMSVMIGLARLAVAAVGYHRPPDDISEWMGAMPWGQYGNDMHDALANRTVW